MRGYFVLVRRPDGERNGLSMTNAHNVLFRSGAQCRSVWFAAASDPSACQRRGIALACVTITRDWNGTGPSRSCTSASVVIVPRALPPSRRLPEGLSHRAVTGSADQNHRCGGRILEMIHQGNRY